MSLNKGTVKAKDVEVINQQDVTTIKEALALGNVDNTSDADKPISTDTLNALNDKVDKVAGQGLSDENYTLSEKDKLAGIESGAEVNTVNSVNTQTGDVVLPVLEGTQYIYVQANGTDTENATELQNAYNTAKTMSPSATNRITVVAGIGNYNFGSSSFDMDTQYIDLVSLDGNRSVVFNSSNAGAGIFVSANDVFIKGIDTQTKPFRIGDNLNLLKIENCKGGNASFGGQNNVPPPNNFSAVNTSGTFTNCEGGNSSFGGANNGTASGTFTNCVGGNGSFSSDDSGGTGLASGIFENCVGGNGSFGGGVFGNEASGTFANCQAGGNSFGGSLGGIASGDFTNCEGGGDDFGGDSGTLSGILTNCVSQGFATFSKFGTVSGKLYRCRNRTSTFPSTSNANFTGKIVLGIDGNDDIINLG